MRLLERFLGKRPKVKPADSSTAVAAPTSSGKTENFPTNLAQISDAASELFKASNSRGHRALPSRGFVGLSTVEAVTEPLLVEIILESMTPRATVSLVETLSRRLARQRMEYLAAGRVVEAAKESLEYLSDGSISLFKDSPTRAVTTNGRSRMHRVDSRDNYAPRFWASKVAHYLQGAIDLDRAVTLTYVSDSSYDQGVPRARTRLVKPVKIDAFAGTLLARHYNGWRTYRLERILAMELDSFESSTDAPVSKLVVAFNRNFSMSFELRRFAFYVAEASDPTPVIQRLGKENWTLGNIAFDGPHIHSELATEVLVNNASLGRLA